MPNIEILTGDMREVLAGLEADRFHSCVTDPPYGLSFMGKEWDKEVPGPEFWKEAFRVLRPGGHLAAFAGTRTAHRMVCAIEDGGFEIRDSLAWVYGQGFPKSLDIGKSMAALRQTGQASPMAIRQASMGADYTPAPAAGTPGYGVEGGRVHGTDGLGATLTPDQEWDGWGTNLKPGWEPIILARKPISERNITANVLRWGTGALNIGGCRVATLEGLNGGRYSNGKDESDGPTYGVGLSRDPRGTRIRRHRDQQEAF